jgi:hypothetical protein
LNWKDADWDFECINFGDFASKIRDIEIYTGFIGGINIHSSRTKLGIVYSTPI